MRETKSELTRGVDFETYGALFRVARDAIIIENKDQRIIDANPAAEILLGYSLEELRKLRTSDLRSLEEQKNAPHQIYSDPDSKENLTFETEVTTNDGYTFPIEITITPFKSEDGWLFLSILRDISVFRDAWANLESQVEERTKDLTAANEEIREREERYRSLIHGSLQGTAILVGPPFGFTFINEAGSTSIGYSSEELQDFTADDVEALVHWTDRSKVLRYIGEILSGKRESVRTEARFNKKSNEVIWFDLSMSGVKIQDKMSLIATFIDVTE